MQNLLGCLPFKADGSITETLHEESFRKEQMCDAAQALVMSVYEKAIQAILAYEQNINPFIAEMDAYFKDRSKA